MQRRPVPTLPNANPGEMGYGAEQERRGDQYYYSDQQLYYTHQQRQYAHHQQQQPSSTTFDLLDDDFDGKRKKNRRVGGSGLFFGGGFVAHNVFRAIFETKSRALACIFFVLFAFFYLRFSTARAKFESFKANANESMMRFKEKSASREKRCLQTLENREGEVGEMRSKMHQLEKNVETEIHQKKLCENRLELTSEKQKTPGDETQKLKAEIEKLRHEKTVLEIEEKKWKDEAVSAKDELIAMKKHHKLEKHDAGVKHHEHQYVGGITEDNRVHLDEHDSSVNTVIDDDGVLHDHTDEYAELKNAFEALLAKTKTTTADEEEHKGSTPVMHTEVQHEDASSSNIPNHRHSQNRNQKEEEEEEEDLRPIWEKYKEEQLK